MKTSSLKLAMLLTTALSLFLIIVGFLFYKNVLISLGAWSNANKIQIFLKTDTEEKEINKIQEEVSKFTAVKSVIQIDRQTAGEEFKNTLKEFSSGVITEDELIDLIPVTLEIELVSGLSPQERQQQIENTVSQIKKFGSLIEEISYSTTWLQKFEKVDKYLRLIGLMAFVSILFLTSFMISLMTRVYIDDSRSDIEVYNLVGATTWRIYKVFFADLFKFLFFGLVASYAASFVFFNTMKTQIHKTNLLPMFVNEFSFLNTQESFVLFGLVLIVFLGHAFYTISSSINSLNQIQND
jgi:cell division protein FtsX